MAVITFTVENSAGSIVNTVTAPQRAKLVQMSGAKRSVQFPYGPQGVTYDGLGLEYDKVERPGLSPLLHATSRKLRSVSITAVLATPQDGGKSSIESQIATIEAMARDNIDCAFTYGVVTLPFRVRITNFDYTAIQRNLDGNITQAEISLQLDENVVFSQSIVALKAIQYPPDPDPTGSTKTPSSSPAKAPTTTASSPDADFVPWDSLNPSSPNT